MIFIIIPLSEIGDVIKDLSHDICYLIETPPTMNPNK